MSYRTPTYCLHKATGQAVVRIDGKDHYSGSVRSDAAPPPQNLGGGPLPSEPAGGVRSSPPLDHPIAFVCGDRAGSGHRSVSRRAHRGRPFARPSVSDTHFPMNRTDDFSCIFSSSPGARTTSFPLPAVPLRRHS